MGLAQRIVLIDRDDRLYRLGFMKFVEMLRDPRRHRLRTFAGQRIREASTSVELVNRKAIRIVRITFNIVTFDDAGRLEADAYKARQFSRAELAMASSLVDLHGATNIVDATSRFLEQGGRWAPSRALARAIDDAVFGRARCPRL